MSLTRLNVGCGTQPVPYEINCDLYPGKGVDVVMDVTKLWPFKEDSVEDVTASHVLEHLSEPFGFINEAHRVLKNRGGLHMRVPYGPSENGFGDVTHLRYYTLTAFGCFQPEYQRESHNLAYDGSALFSVQQIVLRVNPALRWWLKPLIRKVGLRILPYLWGGFIEIIVRMDAIKTKDDVTRWLLHNQTPSLPYCRCIYQHEYEGRLLREEEQPKWIYF